MKPIFSRGLLITIVITFTVALATVILANNIIGRNAMIESKIQDLLPRAKIINSLTLELASGEITQQSYERITSSITTASSTTVFIVDSQFSVIHFAGNDELADALTRMPAKDRETARKMVFAGAEYSSSVIPIGSDHIIMVGVPIYDNKSTTINQAVLLISSQRDVLDPITKANHSMLIALAIVLPLTASVVYFGARAMNKPFNKLLSATKDLVNAEKESDFDIHINDKGLGEYAVFAHALNTLSLHVTNALKNLRMEKRQVNQVIAGLSDGIAAIDIHGNITHFNSAMMRIFDTRGISSKMELIPHQEIWDAFDAVLDSDRPRMFTFILPNGKSVLISISNVYDDDNVCTGAVGLFKDSTEMEQLERMRREYIANVSHELRTPLTTLRGLLEPLSDGMVSDDETKKRYYDIMIREVCRLSRLITDMMTLSKLQSDSVQLEITDVCVSSLINDMLIGIMSHAESKDITVEADIDNNLYALVDEDRLSQLVIILTDNAVKYTADGGKMFISAKYMDDMSDILVTPNTAISNPSFNASKCRDKVVFMVRDTGCGIPKEDLEHIFERFYTVNKSRTKGSTGLGLAIAYQVTRLLDETIIVHSAEGKGATFLLTMKCAHQDNDNNI